VIVILELDLELDLDLDSHGVMLQEVSSLEETVKSYEGEMDLKQQALT